MYMSKEYSGLPTPPHNMAELPDYIHGRLLFQDMSDEDNCKWIVYDGVTFYRCPTRRAAEKLAEEQATRLMGDTAGLKVASHHLTRASQELERIINKEPDTELRIYLDALRLGIRKIDFKLDTIIKQHETEKETNDSQADP